MDGEGALVPGEGGGRPGELGREGSGAEGLSPRGKAEVKK